MLDADHVGPEVAAEAPHERSRPGDGEFDDAHAFQRQGWGGRGRGSSNGGSSGSRSAATAQFRADGRAVFSQLRRARAALRRGRSAHGQGGRPDAFAEVRQGLPEAARFQLLVVLNAEGVEDGAGGDVAVLQQFHDLAPLAGQQPRQDDRVQFVRAVEAVTAAGEALVGQEFGHVEGEAEAFPLGGAGDGDADRAVLAGQDAERVERLGVAVAGAALPHALVGREDDGPLVEGRHRVQGGDVDELAAARTVRRAEGGHRADGGGEAVHVGAPRPAALERLAVGLAGDGGIAAHGPVHERGGAAFRVGAGQAEGAADDGDEARIEAAVALHARGDGIGAVSRLHVDLGDGDVGVRDEAFEVAFAQRRRTLVHAEVLEEGGAPVRQQGMGGAERAPAVRLAGDDVRPGARKEPAAIRGGDAPSQFDRG